MAIVGIALAACLDDGGAGRDARLVVGAAGPVPQRAGRAEQALAGGPVTAARIAEAARAAAETVEVREDIWGSVWYKRRGIGVLVPRGLTGLLGAGGPGRGGGVGGDLNPGGSRGQTPSPAPSPSSRERDEKNHRRLKKRDA